MIPLRDTNPARRPAYVTWALMAACVLVFVFVQQHPGSSERVKAEDGTTLVMDQSTRFTLEYAAVPCEITQDRPLRVTEIVDTYARGEQSACDHRDRGAALFPGKQVLLAALTSIFLHGSWLHLLGNMWFLLLFGNNIEDRLGHWWYAAFYLAAGVVAATAHVLAQPDSTVPVIGASGAIAGVMGAYLVLYPRAPVLALVLWIIPFPVRISAVWFLGIWFVTQFFTAPDSPVAWVAHVAGFVFGVAVALVLRSVSRRPRRRAPSPARWY